jgi:hypothetical protein
MVVMVLAVVVVVVGEMAKMQHQEAEGRRKSCSFTHSEFRDDSDDVELFGGYP